MTNFFRNWGGSFGIAFVNTMSERRFDFHQSVVGANLQASSRASQPRVIEAAAYVHVRGFSDVDAQRVAFTSSSSGVHELFSSCGHSVADCGSARASD
jgi:DHA2 family multidrug resistance protein